MEKRLVGSEFVGNANGQLSLKQGLTRVCPKCHSLNPVARRECMSCQVIFARLKDLPLDPVYRATPHLVELWGRVIEFYENPLAHDQFIEACAQQGALPFAALKYNRLFEVQPHDVIAKKMRDRVQEMTYHEGLQEVTGIWFSQEWKSLIIKYFPIGFSLSLIAVGAIFPALRNLIGLGTALSILAVGLRYYLK